MDYHGSLVRKIIATDSGFTYFPLLQLEATKEVAEESIDQIFQCFFLFQYASPPFCSFPLGSHGLYIRKRPCTFKKEW